MHKQPPDQDASEVTIEEACAEWGDANIISASKAARLGTSTRQSIHP